YSVSALDYLLKPYSMADFQRAANKALLRAEALRARSAAPRSEAPKSIFVKTDTRHIRLELSDISHIKGYGEYLQIFLADSPTPVVTLSSFAAILGRLPECFVQVHRSYIVNMERVRHIERARISLGPDTYIPVGDSYKAALQDYLARLTAGIR
ncbi:MAG: LytTR family transcriptional regulator DNA-binding domain-containing protein, partial [Duncaniella sp.]|nr:LytTR family transcriptional regulator DNA-binding domain-containing protein [Duncaniella sp.]